jgi:hypothetical protein
MRVQDSGTDLVVDDHPTFDRWIGAFNFVIAGACAVIAAMNYRPGGDFRDIFLLLIAPVAGAVALIGLWRALARASIVLQIDGANGSVTLTRGTVWGRRVSRWPADRVARFARAQRPGHDGEPLYRLRLDLQDGASLAVATFWQPDPDAVDAVVTRANALLGK